VLADLGSPLELWEKMNREYLFETQERLLDCHKRKHGSRTLLRPYVADV